MLREELVATDTIFGLAHQLRDLDWSNPMAYERAVTIGAEIERTAGRAVEARGECEFKTLITSGRIVGTEIQPITVRKEKSA